MFVASRLLPRFSPGLKLRQSKHGVRMVFALAILNLVVGTTAAFAQFPQQGNASEDVFLMAPRPLARLWSEARRSIAQGRYADGIQALGAILQGSDSLPDDLKAQDFFLARDADRVYRRTLKASARELLATLDDEGREILEIEFGVEARRQLDAATQARDFSKLQEITRNFPHTEASYDAMILIARQQLTNGFPIAAANAYQTLAEYPAARERFGVGLIQAAALCWMHADSPRNAASILLNGAELFPGGSVVIGGRQIPLTRDAQWLEILESAAEFDLSRRDDSAPDDWLVGGGNESRDAVADITMPLPNARWTTLVHSSVPEKQALLELEEAQRQSDQVMIPKFEVRAVGDLVLAKTTDARVVAIDLETGLTEWPYYFHSNAVDLRNKDQSYLTSSSSEGISEELQMRVWGSSAFGRFSCGTERMYYITADPANVGYQGRNPVLAVSNELHCTSISGQGKILWQIKDDTFFLGPPLEYAGDLYAIIERNNETQLAAYDPNSGKLLWTQQLIHPVYSQLRYDRQRRSQALSPSIANGIAYCPTGAGALVAVDIVNRTLKWATAYSPEVANNAAFQRSAFGFAGMDFSPLSARWQDAEIVVSEGVVVLSPPEANRFYCWDALTGRPTRPPTDRRQGRYIAGVRDGHVFVVGESGVQCFELRSEQAGPVWDVQYPGRSKLVGKGLWLAGSMIIPLSGNRVIEISTRVGDNGMLLNTAEVDQPLGNLFAHKGNLISASATSVSAYHTKYALERQVNERLAADAQDTWGLNQKAQLACASGDTEGSYKLLTESLKINPDNVDTVYLLIETLLQGLKEDFSTYHARAREVEQLVELGPQRFRLLQYLALGSIRADRNIDAFDHLMSLMQQRSQPNSLSAESRSKQLQLSEIHTVDTDNWIATELARCYARASAEEKQMMSDRIGTQLRAISSQLLPLRLQQLRFYNWHPRAADSIIATAIDLLARGDDEQVRAEHMLQPLLTHESEAIQATARKLLSRNTQRDSMDFGPRGRAFPSIYETAGGLPFAELAKDADVSGSLMQPIPWKQGNMETIIKGDSQLYPMGASLALQMERFGRPDIELRLSSNLLIVNNSNGDHVSDIEIRRASADTGIVPSQAVIRGGLILLETTSEIVALDMYRGLNSPREGMLWRQSLQIPGASPNARFRPPRHDLEDANPLLDVKGARRSSGGLTSSVGPTTPCGVILQLGGSIVSLDAYTGREQWSRDGYDDRISIVADGLIVAVTNPSLGQVELLDCRDGSTIDQRAYRENWTHWFSYKGLSVDWSERSGSSNDLIVSPRSNTPVVRVWNPMTGDVVVPELQLARGSRASVCEGKYLAIVEPSSNLHFIDLEKQLYKLFEVETDETPLALHVTRFTDTIVVATSSEQTARRNRIEKIERPRGSNLLPVNGFIYAIDRRQSELQWDKPGILYGMFLPIPQPRNSPFMVAYRSNRDRNMNTLSVAVVDLRDGSLPFSAEGIPTNTGSPNFAMLLRPRTQTLNATIGSVDFMMRVTDQPKPPQPVVSFGYQLQIDAAKSEEQLDIFGIGR